MSDDLGTKQIRSYWRTTASQAWKYASKDAGMRKSSVTAVLFLWAVILCWFGVQIGIVTSPVLKSIVGTFAASIVALLLSLAVFIVFFFLELAKLPPKDVYDRDQVIEALKAQLSSPVIALRITVVNEPDEKAVSIQVQNMDSRPISDLIVSLKKHSCFKITSPHFQEPMPKEPRLDEIPDHERFFDQIEYLNKDGNITGHSLALVKIAEVPEGAESFRWLFRNGENINTEKELLPRGNLSMIAVFEFELQIGATFEGSSIDPMLNHKMRLTFTKNTTYAIRNNPSGKYARLKGVTIDEGQT